MLPARNDVKGFEVSSVPARDWFLKHLAP
jgi:hypothetical protein